MTTHYIGQNPDQLLASDQRFLYALRRTDEGELYFARLDQLSSTDSLTINNPADGDDDYTGFEMGVDFFEGPAKVFEREQAAMDALENGSIVAGDVVVIRYEGP